MMANGEVLYLYAPKVYFCPQLGGQARPYSTPDRQRRRSHLQTPENRRETRQFSLQNEVDRVSIARD
jgi:hypothetical protein